MSALRENADVVIGSRAVDRSLIEKHQSAAREVGGIVFNLHGPAHARSANPRHPVRFQAFQTRQDRQAIFQKQMTSGFGFDPEMLFLASRRD